MNDGTESIQIRILEKDYIVSCAAGEEETLLAAARLLGNRMREARNGGRVIDTERLAVMVALNLAHEAMEQADAQELIAERIDQQVKRLDRRLRARGESAVHRNPGDGDGDADAQPSDESDSDSRD